MRVLTVGPTVCEHYTIILTFIKEPALLCDVSPESLRRRQLAAESLKIVFNWKIEAFAHRQSLERGRIVQVVHRDLLLIQLTAPLILK